MPDLVEEHAGGDELVVHRVEEVHLQDKLVGGNLFGEEELVLQAPLLPGLHRLAVQDLQVGGESAARAEVGGCRRARRRAGDASGAPPRAWGTRPLTLHPHSRPL